MPIESHTTLTQRSPHIRTAFRFHSPTPLHRPAQPRLAHVSCGSAELSAPMNRPINSNNNRNSCFIMHLIESLFIMCGLLKYVINRNLCYFIGNLLIMFSFLFLFRLRKSMNARRWKVDGRRRARESWMEWPGGWMGTTSARKRGKKGKKRICRANKVSTETMAGTEMRSQRIH